MRCLRKTKKDSLQAAAYRQPVEDARLADLAPPLAQIGRRVVHLEALRTKVSGNQHAAPKGEARPAKSPKQFPQQIDTFGQIVS